MLALHASADVALRSPGGPGGQLHRIFSARLRLARLPLFFLRNEIVSFSALRASVRHLSAKFFPHSTSFPLCSFFLSLLLARPLDAVPDARTRLLSSVSNLSSFPLTGHAGVTFANFYRFYDSSALRLAFHGSCLAAQFTPLSTYVPHVDFICASVHGSLFALLLRG